MLLSRIKRKVLGLALFPCVYLAGCFGPYIYRNGLDVNSGEYQGVLRAEISSINRNLVTKSQDTDEKAEKKLRLEAMLDENRDVNFELSFRDHDFYIKKFQTKDKKQITYSVWQPNQEKREVIIYLNGLESHSGWFSETARELTEKGIVVYGIDRRGSGLNSRITGKSDDWINDLAYIIGNAKQQHPGSNINLVATCFGARVAAAASIKLKDIDKIVYISPGFGMGVDVSPIEKVIIGLSCLIGINTPIQTPIKDDILFTRDPSYSAKIGNDLLRIRAANSSDYLEGEKLLNFIKKNSSSMTCPSLVFFVLYDGVIDSERTTRTFSKFSTRPGIHMYESADHAIFFSNEEVRTKFFNDMVNFIEN